MKFFNFILRSSYPFDYWAYHDGDPSTPVPSRLLYYQYSKHHSLLPKSGDPNIACPMQETPVEEGAKYDPLTSLPKHLYSMTEDTQDAHEHDPCSLPPLVSSHSLSYKSAQPNLNIAFEYRPSKHDSDTWSPIQDELLIDLQNGSLCEVVPYCKSKKFLETKVPAMKLQGFNQCLG